MSFEYMKIITIVMVILVAATSLTPLLPSATANPIRLVSITPSSGTVGAIVRVTGEIDTAGGGYAIYWNDRIQLKLGTCQSGSITVDDTFTVPGVASAGVNNITLFDGTTFSESNPAEFLVSFTPSSTLLITPTRIQEGLNTSIRVGIKGAAALTNYALNVSVTAPTSKAYVANLTLATGYSGNGSVSKLFWANFPGADTNSVGTYNVAVNGSLAKGNFTVGLTDKLTYAIMETVHIQGAGYGPSEEVTVDIKINGISIAGYPKNVTADTNGIVSDSWIIPISATTGIYTVTLISASSQGTVKNPADAQVFNVKAIFNIQTLNLDNEPVANITVEAFNATSNNFLASQMTNETGWATFLLDAGNYTFSAFGNDVRIGSLPNQSLPGTQTGALTVFLSSIKIVVEDEHSAALNSINVTFTYKYTTRNGQTLSEKVSLKTNSTGIVEVHNTLANITYSVEARRYGFLFNRSRLDLMAYTQVLITCPFYNLFINAFDSKDYPIGNVQVAVYDLDTGNSTGSPKATNSSGSVGYFRLLLGKYIVRVYNYSVELGSTVILNESAIDLIMDQSFLVQCKIFNVDISVRVVDYFGQPISNALVVFERSGVKLDGDLISDSDGVVLIQNVIGGDYRISIYVAGGPAGVQIFSIDGSRNIPFRLGGYVSIGGHLLGTSQLITLILVGLSVIFLIIIARRKLPILRRKKE